MVRAILRSHGNIHVFYFNRSATSFPALPTLLAEIFPVRLGFAETNESQLAPKLRKEVGTNTGESLVNVIEHNDTIAWEQLTFPAVYLDGNRLPEALPIARTASWRASRTRS